MSANWEPVKAALKNARGIAWDGCHKIYVLMDDRQVAEMRSYGYGEDDDGSKLVGPAHHEWPLRLDIVQNWYDSSCPLKFVNSVKSPGRNEDFVGLIEQGEDEEVEW